MTSMDMGAASVPMMAAMMLPSAVPAIARRAREPAGALGAPLFAGSYLGTWALVALAMSLVYRPDRRPRHRRRHHLTHHKETPMTTHTTGTREQWLAARLELLQAEKELTHRSDDVAKQRQQLPWVPVEKDYRFETEAGAASLADLFGGRSQLLVYHFMFGPEYTGGCPSCSAIADGFNGFAVHLEHHDVGMFAVSRAPIDHLLAYRRRMGWTFPWASSLDSDFNFDFNTSFTEEQQRSGSVEYNYRTIDTTWVREADDQGRAALHAAMTGTDVATYVREQPGMSAFALEDGVVYHTYSAYARGLDGLWGMYQWLDRAPKGRNETGAWWRRRDEY